MDVVGQGKTQLLELLRSHNWDGVRHRLATQEGASEARTRSTSGYRCFPLCEGACARAAPNDVVISLVNTFPDALVLDFELGSFHRELVRNGLMEFFFLRGRDIPVDIMQAMIVAKPECLWVGRFSEDGGICLHQISSLSKNVELVRMVLESHPEGASIQDLKGRLPLHLACQRHLYREIGTSSIIQLLVEKYPSAAQTVDRSFNFPLHYACQRDPRIVPVDSLHLLLDTYPAAAKEPNVKRQTPLHAICLRRNVDLSFLLKLIRQSPGSLVDEDSEGMTPFNICMNEYEKRISGGSYLYPQTNHLDVAGILLYCIYKHCVLEEDTPLKISEARPRSKRERMLCLAYTAHLMHPKDFDFLFNLTVLWHPGHDEVDDFEVDDQEWFQDANGEEEAWEGNTPLHLLWNDMSTYSSRVPRQCYNRDPDPNAMSFSDSDDDDEDENDSDDEEDDNDNDDGDADVEMHVEEDSESEDDCEENYPLSHTKVLFDRLELNQRQRTALASHRNAAGEIPLHRLLKYGRQGAIFYNTLYYDTKILVGAYPESCFVVEPQTNFYPFMIAARNAEDEFQENEPCLSTIFFLLQRYVTERPLIPIE